VRIGIVCARHHRVVRTLRSGQHHTVHQHLILFGFAAEYRMILENQTAPVGVRLAKFVGRDESREAAADDDQIVKLVDGRRIIDPRLVDSIANAVRRIDDGGNVAVGARVITDAGVAVPLRGEVLRERRRGRAQQNRPGPDERRPQKVAPRNLDIQPEGFQLVGISHTHHIECGFSRYLPI
jgi:hypothetical protein